MYHVPDRPRPRTLLNATGVPSGIQVPLIKVYGMYQIGDV